MKQPKDAHQFQSYLFGDSELKDIASKVSTLDFNKPFLLTGVACVTALMKGEGAANALDCLKKIWPNSPLRKNPGRAGQVLVGAAKDTLQSVLMSFAGQSWAPADDSQALKDALAPTMFALCAGHDSVFI